MCADNWCVSQKPGSLQLGDPRRVPSFNLNAGSKTSKKGWEGEVMFEALVRPDGDRRVNLETDGTSDLQRVIYNVLLYRHDLLHADHTSSNTIHCCPPKFRASCLKESSEYRHEPSIQSFQKQHLLAPPTQKNPKPNFLVTLVHTTPQILILHDSIFLPPLLHSLLQRPHFPSLLRSSC